MSRGRMRRPAPPAGNFADFDGLVRVIQRLHERTREVVLRAVNTSLTVRNWMIGRYIVEYEHAGKDRAAYGARLLQHLADRLGEAGLGNCTERELRRCRLFYRVYPQIRGTASPEFSGLPLVAEPRKIRGTLSPDLTTDGRTLVERLSYSHLLELIEVDDPLKRTFYEIQAIQGCWSVRELNRQIASLLYERTALSRNKSAAVTLAHARSERATPAQVIRDPYVFEFLGLKPAEVMGESRIEDALLDRLQEFLLELGRGFCFEARQKRILIGGEHFFVDLVFYHRILRCHVLVELKLGGFTHEHLGQLNTYLNWYRTHELGEGDNPPVGILLCTAKNHALVQYALAGMDNRLFVSKYQLALPRKEEMRRFLEAQVAATRPTVAERPRGKRRGC